MVADRERYILMDGWRQWTIPGLQQFYTTRGEVVRDEAETIQIVKLDEFANLYSLHIWNNWRWDLQKIMYTKTYTNGLSQAPSPSIILSKLGVSTITPMQRHDRGT